MGKRIRYWIPAAFLVLLLGAVTGKILLSKDLETTYLHLYSEKVPPNETLRIVAVSDLHNEEFGEGNQALFERIIGLQPDIVVMAGDMADKKEARTDIAVGLAGRLAEHVPVYYGFGNHEGTMVYEQEIPLDRLLKERGVEVLVNRSERTRIKGMDICIGSISTGPKLYKKYSEEFAKEFEEEEGFRILIAHHPDLFYEKLKDTGADLAVSGHFHGGQIQLPVLGGLYSVDYGLFPQYCSGAFPLKNGTLFVSRGLGNNRSFPRINNRPEVAVIDVNRRKNIQ